MILNVICKLLPGDVETTTAVKIGIPHEVILTYVDDQDIDLVTLGRRGRAGVEQYLLGSVAEKVVRLSDVPVLTVPGAETPIHGG